MFSKMSLVALAVNRLLILVLLIAGVAGCGDKQQEEAVVQPVAFQDGDECHVCGMIISESPGPKGQAIDARGGAVRKFCSTRDMLSWWLQPENRQSNLKLFVHDMARTDWQHPDDRHLINAKDAYYVIGSNLRGAMGPTLASFGSREAAEKLVAEQGGEVLAFDDIDLSKLQELMRSPHDTAYH